MSEHPIVLVRLNSGNFKGRLRGKVSSLLQGDRTAFYEIELINHPTLATVRVAKDQIIRTLEDQ